MRQLEKIKDLMSSVTLLGKATSVKICLSLITDITVAALTIPKPFQIKVGRM
jgi:hypothetical protein